MRAARNRAGEREELMRFTLGSIGDAVITTDTQGRVTSLNSVAESLTGWTNGEASGQPLDTVFRVFSEDTRQPVENPAVRALREGAVVGLANHTILIARDGAERSIDDSAAPIVAEDGRVSGSVLIFRDISQRRQWERDEATRLLSARQLASIVESSDDAIIRKSLDGMIQSWNAGAERLFGYPASEAIGRHISLIIPPERIAEEDQIIASLKAGHRVDHFETERRHRSGRLIWVSLTVSPITDADGKRGGGVEDRARRHAAARGGGRAPAFRDVDREQYRLHRHLRHAGRAVVHQSRGSGDGGPRQHRDGVARARARLLPAGRPGHDHGRVLPVGRRPRAWRGGCAVSPFHDR